jgi:hypothetical protein
MLEIWCKEIGFRKGVPERDVGILKSLNSRYQALNNKQIQNYNFQSSKRFLFRLLKLWYWNLFFVTVAQNSDTDLINPKSKMVLVLFSTNSVRFVAIEWYRWYCV